MSLGNLLIRADASVAMGTGHVMRCLALAQAWRRVGGAAAFLMAATTPAVTQKLQSEGFDVFTVEGTPGSSEDAGSVARELQEQAAKWVVFDGYQFGVEYRKSCVDRGCKVLVVDDLGGADYGDADVILNQNIHAMAAEYSRRGERTRLLLGPRYAMLREEFRRAGAGRRETPLRVTKVLVTAGGSDPRNLVANIRQGLELVVSERLEIRIVVGGDNPDELPSLSTDRHSVQMEKSPPDMARLMEWAELAVSAAGSTCWELCAMGVPAIVIDVAENQRPIAEELGRRGIAVHAPFEEASGGRIAKELEGLIGSADRRAEMSSKGRELVDGRGVDRVVAAMRAEGLRLRRATQDDCRLLWEWANDPATRRASFQRAEIPWEDHRAWFGMKMKDRRCLILIAEEDGAAMGTVRADRTDSNEPELSVTVAPNIRGAGLAAYLIEQAADQAMEELGLAAVWAWIKKENVSSIRAFEHAGFQFVREVERGGAQAAGYVKVRHTQLFAPGSRVAAGSER